MKFSKSESKNGDKKIKWIFDLILIRFKNYKLIKKFKLEAESK